MWTLTLVVVILGALKPKISYGPDGFPNLLLKRLASVICEPLSFIFQSSFRLQILPACWLHVLVTPVFKKGLILVLATTDQYPLHVSVVM